MRLVHGYFCRNCADEELAKRGIDPSRPNREFAGSEVYVPPWMAKDPGEERRETALGVNQPEAAGATGRVLNLYA